MKKKTPKIITSVYVSNAILVALSTTPLEALGKTSKNPSKELNPHASIVEVKHYSEKILFSKSGFFLNVMVKGKPGRYFTLIFQTEKMPTNKYKFLRGKGEMKARGIISKSGIGNISINLKDFLDNHINIRLITSDNRNLNIGSNLRGTENVKLFISSREIKDISKLQLNTRLGSAAAAGKFCQE